MRAGTVLLVEDSIEVRDVVAEILTRDGYAVSTTCDGLSAWKMISSQHFDLVISDMGLPGMDGRELLRNMRKNSIKTPVLLTSGVRISENISCGDMADCRLIYKPFEINEIKNFIFDLLNKK